MVSSKKTSHPKRLSNPTPVGNRPTSTPTHSIHSLYKPSNDQYNWVLMMKQLIIVF